MEHEKILRINELAKKKKEVGLTDEEAEERKTLHAQYIKEFPRKLVTPEAGGVTVRS